MKRLVIAAAAVIALSASAAAQEKLKVGWIYVGPVGDFGWTYQHEVGRQAVVKALGDKVDTTYLENVSEGPDAERSIEQLARSGHKLIFTTSFGFMDATVKVAKKYPNLFFEHATGYKREKNLATYSARFYEGRTIQGLIAAKMSKSGIMGYIGSVPIPEVISGINATMLAAQTINPNIKVKIIWVGEWFNPGKEADAAKALLDQGADVLMQHTDSAAAVETAAKRGIPAFGQDSDMIKFGPEDAADRDRQQLGALLHRAHQARARRQMDLGRRMGRAQVRNGDDGALHQHARRREEDGGRRASRYRCGQTLPVQVSGRRPGRQDRRVQGRRHARRRPDPGHELLRQRRGRQSAREVNGNSPSGA